MTAEETEELRSEDRLRTIVRRNNMIVEETKELPSDDQLRAIFRKLHLHDVFAIIEWNHDQERSVRALSAASKDKRKRRLCVGTLREGDSPGKKGS
ncbi:hypothetical protein AVEN_133786-1 [Araneus ventricosus]|uniref:Uncharacterized protein n=1 Tax=Araneus ventricosus TaxID=182803 RepID=A0A4Y2L124_ARAVE|nr:hypothetical protein AVEN_133786-1 [Araneus ventricosus]